MDNISSKAHPSARVEGVDVDVAEAGLVSQRDDPLDELVVAILRRPQEGLRPPQGFLPGQRQICCCWVTRLRLLLLLLLATVTICATVDRWTDQRVGAARRAKSVG